METGRDEKKTFTRGLYRGVKVSVRALDWMIGIGTVIIAALIIFGISHNGYSVTYDSRGGSDVPYVKAEYGQILELPEDPQREGYTFAGWYLDENYKIPYDASAPVEGDLTLYARWEKEASPSD